MSLHRISIARLWKMKLVARKIVNENRKGMNITGRFSFGNYTFFRVIRGHTHTLYFFSETTAVPNKAVAFCCKGRLTTITR